MRTKTQEKRRAVNLRSRKAIEEARKLLTFDAHARMWMEDYGDDTWAVLMAIKAFDKLLKQTPTPDSRKR